MVHARVLEAYIHIALMYTPYHFFPVLPIKYLPYKLAADTKPSVSHLRLLFCPCVSRKANAHVGTKTLNMQHQSKRGFSGIFVGIPLHQKGYLVYVPISRNIISSYDVVFNEIFSSVLAYTPQPY